MLRVGKFGLVNNFLPYYFLRGYRVISASPKEMASMLLEGKIDYAPVPAYFYLKNSERLRHYTFCVASDGEVLSVIVVSRNGRIGDKIAVTSETMTSVNLLKILLAEKGLNVRLIPSEHSRADDLLRLADSALVIGDEAIKARMIYRVAMDLGEEWKDLTGYPMVFGISASLKDVNAEKVDRDLINSVRLGMERIGEVVKKASEEFKLPEEFLEKYFKVLVYELGSREMKGLRAFAEMCGLVKTKN